jgi:DNA gyrase subunit A
MADEEKPKEQLPLEGGGPLVPSNVHPVNIEDEMRQSYLAYSMSVIVGRALPDIRDGLKPVHRRILYAMHDMNLVHNKKYMKCAGVVGECLKKYHPHGDSSVYDALVRLAQDFSLRYPLVDGQGNFGSVDGDPPAAYRYTESRMTALAEEMLADIDKDTVDFVPNFDESTAEPAVLPSRFPNLLVNGSNGIAVGMATNIPPHNMTEIVNACIMYLNNTATTLDDMLTVVQGPDFPTAGIIYGKRGIKDAYTKGRGRFVVRARAAVEHVTKEKDAIIVTEIPYQVNKSRLIEKIAELVNDKTIDDISDIRDESDRDGMRIVIELKRGAQPEIVLNQLYKHTQLQDSFSMIFLAVVNGQPKELGLVEAVRYFVEHRIDVVRRRTVFLLNKAREREHVLEGYKIALDNLDLIIKIIRGSNSRADAKVNLLASKFILIDEQLKDRVGGKEGSLTPRQADAILELQLYRLTRMSTTEIMAELAEIRDRIAEYVLILSSEAELHKVIIAELEQVRDDFGDERRTQIVEESSELQLEDLIADEQVAVTVSHTGYFKRTPISTYRQQRRGGTGRTGMKTREEDFVEQLFVASTHDYILIFTNTGRVYWLKVYEIPDVGAAGKGKHLSNLVALQPGETSRAMLPVRDLTDASKFIFFVTRNGVVKKTPLPDFSNVMARGIIAIGIDKEDELVDVKITDGEQFIFLASHDGMAIRFDENDVRSMGRPARGVRGMDLHAGDYIVGAAATAKNAELAEGEEAKKRGKRKTDEEKAVADMILTVSENGYGKRTPAVEYRITKRGGKGIINMKTTPAKGKVIGSLLVSELSEAMLISQFGKIIRMGTDHIREAGRATQGVRLLALDLEGGDKVAAAVIIPDDEKSDNGGDTPETGMLPLQ